MQHWLVIYQLLPIMTKMIIVRIVWSLSREARTWCVPSYLIAAKKYYQGVKQNFSIYILTLFRCLGIAHKTVSETSYWFFHTCNQLWCNLFLSSELPGIFSRLNFMIYPINFFLVFVGMIVHLIVTQGRNFPKMFLALEIIPQFL